jgi:hypothetical protein
VHQPAEEDGHVGDIAPLKDGIILSLSVPVTQPQPCQHLVWLNTHPQDVIRQIGKRADRVDVESDLGAGHYDDGMVRFAGLMMEGSLLTDQPFYWRFFVTRVWYK